MATISQMLRCHTHKQSNEQGLYTCTPTASIFVCFSPKVHRPPLESSESHAGGAALKVCQRGEAPGPVLESPIASQSPRQRTSPIQGDSRAEERRGPVPTGNTLSISTRCESTQILFHSETCAATCGTEAVVAVVWSPCISKMSRANKRFLVLFVLFVHSSSRANPVGFSSYNA